MKGHYHIKMEPQEEGDEEVCINEESLTDAINIAQANSRKVIDFGFVCTFGCGMMHPLSADDLATLRAAIPELPTQDSAGRSTLKARPM